MVDQQSASSVKIAQDVNAVRMKAAIVELSMRNRARGEGLVVVCRRDADVPLDIVNNLRYRLTLS